MIRRLVLALVLLAVTAHAQPFTGNAGPDAFLQNLNGGLTDLRNRFRNILDFGAVGNGNGQGGGSDNCNAFTAAFNAVPATGGTIYIPEGRFISSCPIPFRSNIRWTGAGINGTIIQTVQNGASAGYGLFQSSTPRTCTGGAGSCDGVIAGAARGAGCICYTNADCTSNVCAGGSTSRDVRFDHFKVIVYNQGSVGVNLAFCSECALEDSYIVASGNPNNAYGVLGSDGNSTVAGYSATIFATKIEAFGGTASAGIRLLAKANDWKIIADEIDTGNTVGLQIDSSVNSTHVLGTMFQSDTTGILDTGNTSLIQNCRFESTSTGTAITINSNTVNAQINNNYFTTWSTAINETAASAGVVIGPNTYLSNGTNVALAGSTTVLIIDPVLSYTAATLPSVGVGSVVKCSDCTVANPCAGSGGGSAARRIGTIASPVWACN